MGTSEKNEKESNPTKLPEQKLGDTPVPPWEMPTPEEKEQAKPIRRALKEAVARVDSPEKAEEVIEKLETSTADQKIQDLEGTQPAPATPASAARQVEKAAQAAPEEKKTEKVLKTTARVIAAGDKHQREVVSEAVQEVLNPEQQGAAPAVANQQEREYLRQAVLRRLKPVDALDANLFLFVNHFPHTHLLNTFFYSLTVMFNGGMFWFATLVPSALRRPHRIPALLREIVLPLTVTTALVEFPIKAYFRRRRPFITIIQAIVIGKKPGTWSFPSGHSAAAFAGAWLLNHKFPRRWRIRYVLASLVAFSRIYLGDHYPGDVASGSLLGLLFAMFFRKVFNLRKAGNK
jgi:undecaprenyl-diphosphatase